MRKGQGFAVTSSTSGIVPETAPRLGAGSAGMMRNGFGNGGRIAHLRSRVAVALSVGVAFALWGTIDPDGLAIAVEKQDGILPNDRNRSDAG